MTALALFWTGLGCLFIGLILGFIAGYRHAINEVARVFSNHVEREAAEAARRN